MKSSSFFSAAISDHTSWDSGDLLSQVSAVLSSCDLGNAKTLLQELASRNPESAEYLVKLGHVCYKLQSYAESEHYYCKALSVNCSGFLDQLWFGLGQVYFAQKNYAKSYSAFMGLLSGCPNLKFRSLCYLKLGISCKEMSDFLSSHYYLNSSLAHNDLNLFLRSEALCQLGNNFEKTGNAGQALTHYLTAFKLVRNFRTCSCVAWGYLGFKPALTISICNKFLGKTSNLAERLDIKLLEALGNMRLGYLEKAKQILEDNMRNFGLNIVYLGFLAMVYEKLSELGKTVEICKVIAETWPMKGESWANLSIAYRYELKQVESDSCLLEAFTNLNSMEYQKVITKFSNGFYFLSEPAFSITDFPLCEDLRYSIECSRSLD